MSGCEHVWVLWKEGNWTREPTLEEKSEHERRGEEMEVEARKRGAFVARSPLTWVSIGTERRWYCSRCRIFDVTHSDEPW